MRSTGTRWSSSGTCLPSLMLGFHDLGAESVGGWVSGHPEPRSDHCWSHEPDRACRSPVRQAGASGAPTCVRQLRAASRCSPYRPSMDTFIPAAMKVIMRCSSSSAKPAGAAWRLGGRPSASAQWRSPQRAARSRGGARTPRCTVQSSARACDGDQGRQRAWPTIVRPTTGSDAS
jgi:hypothetical protein